MTHILIPIKDIKESKRNISKLFKSENNPYTSLIKVLESKGKQISLDEKDIEEKADKFPKAPIEYDNNESFSWKSGWSTGYKQALKDLL